RLADRFGIMVPVIAGTIAMALGYAGAASAHSLWLYALSQGLLIGTGRGATFAPLLAHVSLWFARRRGIAIAIFASGNYLAGTVWPPIVQYFIQSAGWRETYFGIALFCLASMLPLALFLRRPPPVIELELSGSRAAPPVATHALGLSSGALQTLLIVAGLCCCVAMSMPQVRLVAYCSDLGYGPARGAQMLSLMLACGIISRLTFGFICDRVGGLRTLLLGSGLQGLALLLFLPFNGLVSLYVISALFGLFQGGIVPSYAIIVREFFSPSESGRNPCVVRLGFLGAPGGSNLDLDGLILAMECFWSFLLVVSVCGACTKSSRCRSTHPMRLRTICAAMGSASARNEETRRCPT